MIAKFKAWDRHLKKMFQVTTLDIAQDMIISKQFHVLGELLHFTQSLDTENNEIYNGDKIMNENNTVAIVYWHEEYLAWYVYREEYTYVIMPLYKFKGKVIGNINEK